MTDQETKKLDPQTIMLAASVPVIAIVLMAFVTLNIISEPSRFLTSAQTCYDKWLPGRLAEIHKQQISAAEAANTSSSAKFALNDLEFTAGFIPDAADFWDYKEEYPGSWFRKKEIFLQAWSKARTYTNQIYSVSGVLNDYPAGDPELIAKASIIKSRHDEIEKNIQALQDSFTSNMQLYDSGSELKNVLLSKQDKLKDPSVSDADKWYILDEPGARDCLPGSIVTSIAEWRMGHS